MDRCVVSKFCCICVHYTTCMFFFARRGGVSGYCTCLRTEGKGPTKGSTDCRPVRSHFGNSVRPTHFDNLGFIVRLASNLHSGPRRNEFARQRRISWLYSWSRTLPTTLFWRRLRATQSQSATLFHIINNSVRIIIFEGALSVSSTSI